MTIDRKMVDLRDKRIRKQAQAELLDWFENEFAGLEDFSFTGKMAIGALKIKRKSLGLDVRE